jgi:hypothetical protein
VESAGLCARCSPHIKDVFAVCVIDCLAGVGTPKKIGPMLKLADLVVLTKGDIVSQAEREVMAFRTKQASPRAAVLAVNGITGQGAQDLAEHVLVGATETPTVREGRLRFSMPTALCSYCLGETKLGDEYQRGYVRKIDWNKTGGASRGRGVVHGPHGSIGGTSPDGGRLLPPDGHHGLRTSSRSGGDPAPLPGQRSRTWWPWGASLICPPGHGARGTTSSG